MISKTLYFTVTNDLVYDQRMHRICDSLAEAGYRVCLVGRKLPDSVALQKKKFTQKRLYCFFRTGFLFYAEYNIRLFLFLLFKKMDGICAIDLDTILPVWYISRLKKVVRIYDAHELFCEMKEIVSRPKIYAIWKKIERKTLPHFPFAYTVNEPIAKEYEALYVHPYEVIRNMARLETRVEATPRANFIIYQGAVNEGRCFEQLIPAMKKVSVPLHVYGDGNFLEQAKQLCKDYSVTDKVFFKGKLPPDDLRSITRTARLGINLVENESKSFYLSLSNRFFDYIHAGTPQLCMNYPAYKSLNDKYDVAVTLNKPEVDEIANKINALLDDEDRWEQLHHNCLQAAKELNWPEEEKKLLNFYSKIFG